MKKLVFLTVVAAVLVAGLSAYATNPVNNTPAYIHYQVNIGTSLPPDVQICQSIVMITDQNGSAVNGSQAYRPYISSYNFYELGPVTGTRVAVIMNLPLNIRIFCPLTPLPVVKHATFQNGATYSFSMFYGPKNPSPIPLPPGVE
jgi:hypothetical protein